MILILCLIVFVIVATFALVCMAICMYIDDIKDTVYNFKNNKGTVYNFKNKKGD